MVPSGIRKVNEKALAMERNGEKVYHFEIGRPDFDTPDYIKKACIDSLNNGDVFYTSNFGYQELREEIAKYLTDKKHIPTTYEEVLVTVGLAEAVYDVLSVILEEGDEILVPDPVWMNYINIPRMLGAVDVKYSLLEQREYQPDFGELSAKITDKTKAIVLVSPHNPTGSMLSRESLEGIAELAKKNNLLVLSDEIYERLVYHEEGHISIASLPDMKERSITLNGFSKAYSMTGWRIGYVSAKKELILAINKIHQVNTTSAASFVQKAAIAALREEKTEVEDMRREYRRRRDYAVKAINGIPGLQCAEPAGAFYIFINIKALGISSAKFAEYLLENEKIALVPGEVFGENGEGYLRMSFANSLDNIAEGIQRLAHGVEAIKKEESGYGDKSR
ncbi:MAG: pyridoxal phosphate-dependent aminotransferase [Lachnospiraceae bacterium]|nr:pyridoxal phosphate-dependent aminotransferase [Lachnospiraceae bacterium]